MHRLTFFLLLFCLPTLAATVWKWRDADGVLHYSDQPVPGAEQVGAQSTNTFSTSSAASSSAQSSTSSAAAVVKYTKVEIQTPANQATIANSGGAVSMSVLIEPQLAAQHHLALYLDGKLVAGYPPQALSFTLSDVERGEHSLLLVVLDAKENRVASSAPVTFYVQQPSVLRR